MQTDTRVCYAHTYLWPISWAMVKARFRPLSSAIIHFRFSLHIPLRYAIPRKQRHHIQLVFCITNCIYCHIIDPKQTGNLILVRATQTYEQLSAKGLLAHKSERLILAQNWIKNSKEIASSGKTNWLHRLQHAENLFFKSIARYLNEMS